MELRNSGASNYLKYQTRNPLVQALIRRFLHEVVEQIRLLRPERIVDIGCGDGQLARVLNELPFAVDYQGFDVNEEALRIARRQNPDRRFNQADLMQMELADNAADLVVCLEVLEHLTVPAEAMQRIARWTSCAALLSVPWEPYFRVGSLLRGKYLAAWGNHPEHVQHFTRSSFRKTAAAAFNQVRVNRSFPWLLAICCK